MSDDMLYNTDVSITVHDSDGYIEKEQTGKFIAWGVDSDKNRPVFTTAIVRLADGSTGVFPAEAVTFQQLSDKPRQKTKHHSNREYKYEHPKRKEHMTQEGLDMALKKACYNDFTKLAKVLLEYGADPSTHNTLYWASRDGYLEMTKLLLEYGADREIDYALRWS